MVLFLISPDNHLVRNFDGFYLLTPSDIMNKRSYTYTDVV